MNSANKTNAVASATMLPAGKLTEAEFLAREAAAARAAMDGAVREVIGVPAGKDGWREWAGRHPLALISGAAVAGALAARLLTPRGHNGQRQAAAAGGFAAMLRDLGKDFLRTFLGGLFASQAAPQSRVPAP